MKNQSCRRTGKTSFSAVVSALLAALLAFLYAGRQTTASRVSISGIEGPAVQEPDSKRAEMLALLELRNDTNGRVKIATNRGTQKVNFVWLDQDTPGSLSKAGNAETSRAKAAEFLRRSGVIFGLSGPGSTLIEKGEQVDALGFRRLEYEQFYNGVPVFSGIFKIHFNPAGELRAANGTLVPAINLNTTPTKLSDEAVAISIAKIRQQNPAAGVLNTIDAKLYVYRSGLIEGTYGENHLAWRIELSNRSTIHEAVFVDAHTGEVLGQLSERRDALDRRLYDGLGEMVFPPISFPDNPFWIEGQSFPTGNVEADNVLLGSKETYDLFRSAFGRDSYDDHGSPMTAFFNLGGANAFQEDYPVVLTVYGPGWTDDDVVGHEWTHAYSRFTHDLIYFAQPGALNEAYSDIFGEVVDLLNGRGLDTPGGRRDANNRYCSTLIPALPILKVNSPSSIAGNYDANRVVFGPSVPAAGISTEIVLVNDGVGEEPGSPGEPTRADGCETPFVNAAEVNGKIVLVDPTSVFYSPCGTNTQVKNAQENGAVGVVIGTYPREGEVLVPYFFADDPSIAIPSIVIGNNADTLIRSQLANGVNASMTYDHAEIQDATYRWLQFEQDKFGITRDMWRPGCRRMPGKTSDKNYYCGFADDAGVHWNSAVPVLTFALLADGGTYNGRTINGIGLTKALHIYYRAMTVYQVPLTDFADHANAIEASAADLVGRNLPDLVTGAPSGERIDRQDLLAVHTATLATELRNYPANCSPLIGKNPPADGCTQPGTKQKTLFADSFEGNPIPRWQVGREDYDPATFIPRDWKWVRSLPGNRPGSAMFAIDPLDDCTSPVPGQAGVLILTSPSIRVPDSVVGGPHASFEHYVNTEFGWDGAQVMVSVNEGPFQLVPREKFIYSPYNFTLFGPYNPPNNPREGQWAFTGGDPIPFGGSWGTSIIDLSDFAQAGDTVRLRFDLSTDYCFGTDSGWYVDNVSVYACVPGK